jgi:transcriptional antiterminator NusG
MSNKDNSLGRQWYAVHTYFGYEDSVKRSLEQRIESMNMQDHIFEIVVPKEKIIKTKNGKQVITESNLFPGYILVNMIVTDNSWFAVRNTPNVTGFAGAQNTPVPILPEEFNIIQKRMNSGDAKVETKLSEGDLVTLKEGPFSGYEGIISKVNTTKAKVTVMISVFNRDTPVEMDFTQVVIKD